MQIVKQFSPGKQQAQVKARKSLSESFVSSVSCPLNSYLVKFMKHLSTDFTGSYSSISVLLFNSGNTVVNSLKRPTCSVCSSQLSQNWIYVLLL